MRGAAQAAATTIAGPSRKSFIALAAGLAALLLAACGGRPLDFATVQDARTAGVFEQGRLPDVLPASGTLLRVEAEADDGGYFHFSSADYAPMTAKLAPLSAMPDDPAVQSWIKRKGLAGYAAFEHRTAAARWLLLCSQPKGRCYVRRLA
jgi:hypothetical protein